MKHRILAWMLAVSLVLILMPASAMAVEEPVAEVNGTEYTEERFQEAIMAAKDGGTVKLLRSYTLELGGSRLDLSGFCGAFDLNACTLTLNTTNEMAVYASGAELTVKNGSLNGSSDSFLIYSTNGGSLSMEDVTVNYTASGSQPMTVHTSVASTFKNVTINAKNAGCVEAAGKNAVFENCTFKTTEPGTGHPYTAVAVSYGAKATVKSGTYEALYGLYVYSSGGTIDVQGGSFTGTAAAMRADADAGCTSVITVSDGTFNGDIQKGTSGTTNIELSGGSYTANPSAYLADGYLAQGGDGSYQVAVDTSKIIEVLTAGQTSGTKYASLAEALEQAEDYSTLKLLADVPISEDITLSKTCIVDLNGHDLTGSSTLTVPSGIYLTINGTGTVACNITNQGNSKYALSLNGGSYTGTVSGLMSADGPGAKFSAGTYSAETIPLTLTGCALKLNGEWYEFEAITYTINLNLNDGTLGEGFSTPIIYTYTGVNVTLPKVSGNTIQITRPGWTFGGWYYSGDDYTSSSNRAAMASSGKISAATIAGKADAGTHVLDLYAKWTKVKEAAVLDANGNQTATYGTVQEAIDAVQPGQSVKLLTDAVLADDTPVKIVDKGTADSPIILDLNGKTISGSNTNNNFGNTATTKLGGILWMSGSYVTLTDTSDETKGGIVNTADSGTTATMYVNATQDHGGHVVIDGGVKIENCSSGKNAKVIWFQNNANKTEELRLDIQNAQVDGTAYTIYTSLGTSCSGKIHINGGEFTSSGKQNNESAFSGTFAVIAITGGKFRNWNTGCTNMVADEKAACVSEEDNGTYTVTVQDAAPDTYLAKVADRELYVTSGNLYGLRVMLSAESKITADVVKSASYTTPAGAAFGFLYGEPYTLALRLTDDVTLSGKVVLKIADVTVSGGSVDSKFQVVPFDDTYEMTATGDGGVYSCRLKDTATGAYLIQEDGTTWAYPLVFNALNAARSYAGCTVKLNKSGNLVTATGGAGNVTLMKASGVVADITLDLNGHTLTYTGSGAPIKVKQGAKLTVVDNSTEGGGQLAVTAGAQKAAITTDDGGGTVVIDRGVTIKGAVWAPVANSELVVAGTVDSSGLSGFAIAGNGSSGQGPTKITIKEGAVIKTSGEDSAAIYHPQSGELIVEGGTIEGGVGIQMCAGTLNISGSPAITANGAHAPENAGNDGSIPDGAAISIVNRSYPGGTPTLTITGTPTVTAANGVDAVQAYTWNAAGKTQKEWADAGANVNISGGTYSTRPNDALLAEGYAAKLVEDASGNYIVEQENPTHEHEWSTEWTYDADAHWHECTAGGCDVTENSEKNGYGAHIYDDDADDTCNTCGYVRALDPDGKAYQIDTSVTGGTITPSAQVAEGGSMTVEYAPGTGYTAEGVSVKVDGVDVDAPSCYTFEAVTGDHNIVVVYTKANEPDEPVVTTANIDLVGPNDSWPDTPCITLTDGAVTAVQAAGGIGEAFSVPANTTLPYWAYKGWTFTAAKDGATETCGTFRVLTRTLADWLTAKINEGGWTLTMDSKTPGVYTPSSGGSSGGGFSSCSSTTKTETTKNPDGSTTTTVTDTKTGTVTETVKTADGVTGTTVTDKKGNVTEVKATVPAAAAKKAAKSGEAVTLPVEVPAGSDADDAAEISVTVPKSAGAVKVEIPVEKVTPGTVAVIVKADGTEEIVKTSVTTADGVALTLEGSATVKIVDNSKEFVDVHPVDHWAEASIDFVTSRELFNGKTADTFAPNDSTTRAQLMTVLARLDGADTAGAALEKGMAWAVQSGISDGTNPSGTITRQQLAAMLYRYAGSPATDYELTHSDAHRVSDYAVDAMRWAVANGIITGKADGTLDPHGLATRAQVATMMARYCAKIG